MLSDPAPRCPAAESVDPTVTNQLLGSGTGCRTATFNLNANTAEVVIVVDASPVLGSIDCGGQPAIGTSSGKVKLDFYDNT
jgi:hypothetical protein